MMLNCILLFLLILTDFIKGEIIMKGLESLLPHLITIGLLWLVVIIVIQLIKAGIFRGMDKLQADNEVKAEIEKRKEKIRKTVSIANTVVTVIALAIFFITAVFLFSPMERTYEEMDKIKEAVVDEDYVPPSKEEIEEFNIESHDMKISEAKETEAEKENIEAMKDSISLFREIAKEAEAKEVNEPNLVK